MLRSPPSPIITRHVEDGAFLWVLRAQAVAQSNSKLVDQLKLESRLEAHLDGLRVAGISGWEAVLNELTWKEAGEFFIAASLALGSPEQPRWPFLMEKLSAAEDGVAGVASAVAWNESAATAQPLRFLLASDVVNHRRAGLAAAAANRRDPEGMLALAAKHTDQLLCARAMKAIGELGRVDLLTNLLSAFSDDDLTVQFQAANAAALLGGGQRATALLQQLAEAGLMRSEQAAMMAGRAMPLREANVWQDQLTGEANPRLPIIVAGATGDPKHLPWLVEQMESRPVARLAGEAFSMITGADLAYLDMDRKPPKDFEAGPTEDPADENVAMDVDEHLPWPNPKKIHKWCATHARNLRPGVRHLLGKPIEPNSLQHALRHGYQRQRAAAAIELSLARPGTPLFNVKAPAFRQQKLLGL